MELQLIPRVKIIIKNNQFLHMFKFHRIEPTQIAVLERRLNNVATSFWNFQISHYDQTFFLPPSPARDTQEESVSQ